MTKQKVGKVLFWIAVIWAFLWRVIGSVFCSSAMNSMTMEELNESMWAMTGPMMFLVLGWLFLFLGFRKSLKQ